MSLLCDASQIDLQPEALVGAICIDELPNFLQLTGARPGGQFWGAQSSFIGCAFFDVLNGLDSSVFPITVAEGQACINILLASQMLPLNNCPPPGP